MKGTYKQETVAVIIPVYNAEKYLSDCLDSVCRQTYPDMEIIVINDDSSDNSPEIIKEFCKRDGRIKTINVAVHNAALVRKAGVEAIQRSKYVCFVDGDDIIHSKYVELLYSSIKKTGYSIATAKIKNFSENQSVADVSDINHGPHLTEEKDVVRFFFEHYFPNREGDYIAQSINCKIFKTSLFQPVDYSVLKADILEDNYIVPQLLKQLTSEPIVLIDEVAYYYREHQDSTMHKSLDHIYSINKVEYNYVDLFEDAMNFISNTFKGYQRTTYYIEKTKAKRYYLLAQDAVVYCSQIRSLEHQTANLSRLVDEKEGALRRLNDEKCAVEMKYNDILNSRTWRLKRKFDRLRKQH